MSDLNLLRYYTRLTPLGVGEEIKTSLTDISELLFTSLRHARNLMNQMHDMEWLAWSPQVGRNKRSSLVLNYDLVELKHHLATKRITAGKYEKALAILDNDETEFGRLLQNTSGTSLREGRLHLQLTYKRSFERLVPHQLHRSSERYLMRQIYCCLVQSNKHGQLCPQLAHHWQHDESATQWSFYLRPGLTFHNGAAIDADAIVSLFAKLSSLPEYQVELGHLSNVSAPNPLKVVFSLSKPDFGFGGLISGVRYSIQPTSQVNNAQTLSVIGSGPFSVAEHSESRLKLQAFDRYYECRALTDEVSIWLFKEKDKQQLITTNQPGAGLDTGCNHFIAKEGEQQHDSDIKHSHVEDGCMFVLFNQQSHSPTNLEQRRYLASLLSPEAIHHQLHQQGRLFGCELAGNLLPIWHKVLRPFSQVAPLPKLLSIATYDYIAGINCALCVQTLLEAQGVEVEVNIYSYRDLVGKAQRKELSEDLIITNINLDDNRHASAFGSLFSNDVLHYAIGEQAQQWLSESLESLRASTPLEEYLHALEPIACTLISEHHLTPLFHHRQTLRFHGVLKDVALTNWGWPDIRNVWSTN
ncbi:SgrR family transcriptional regulator [Vibrio paucivorans]